MQLSDLLNKLTVPLGSEARLLLTVYTKYFNTVGQEREVETT